MIATAQVCSNCQSAETQTMADGYDCILCGARTRYKDVD